MQPESRQEPVSVIVTSDGTLVVRTVCPRCLGLTVQRFANAVPGSGGHKGGGGDAGRPDAQRPRTIVCGCGMPHDGRPAEGMEHGCGAYWKVFT
jgi:hypothetical protein